LAGQINDARKTGEHLDKVYARVTETAASQVEAANALAGRIGEQVQVFDSKTTDARAVADRLDEVYARVQAGATEQAAAAETLTKKIREQMQSLDRWIKAAKNASDNLHEVYTMTTEAADRQREAAHTMMERIREQSQTLDNRIAELKSTVAGTGEQIDRMTTLTAEARTAAFDLSFNLAQVQQHAELAEASCSSRMQDLTAKRAEAENQASQLESVLRRAEKMATELSVQLEAFFEVQKQVGMTIETLQGTSIPSETRSRLAEAADRSIRAVQAIREGSEPRRGGADRMPPSGATEQTTSASATL
ncbi:MAG: hypothetical protein GX616_16505, partial [Planctomycetes bacterium]|nr:hypothetical protein [Planctomycetota bacterium]